ncbi:hypothetical protein NDN11_11840 [Acinetobacter sp. C26M]|uniref:hypothetical protein n=1 Tax=unclassified Acinetobacter TaxID=196816 RepID=UPI00203666A3|nr:MULTISPECIES: hypothetical protein [unclassified Acinetobacter]USA45413.1 hypothetical protein NDN11_11840 [Acinetobacter sp. C26M]USA48915.1 hypothetical protein NDN12_11840 [Acinetobacter sp. C26G]
MNEVKSVLSLSQLKSIKLPVNGQLVYMESYHEGLNRGGGFFIYDSNKSGVNDGVFVFNGWTRQNFDKVTPDMAGAKPNDSSFDNADILNLVFSTGLDIYGKSSDSYKVKKSLRTKGQKLIGGWKIDSTKATSRSGTWSKVVKTNIDGLDTSNNIRMLYVSSAWDLSEFLAIKELGFNMIHHYVGMSVMGWDRDGNVFDVLNNAMSAGLKVSLGIEQDPNAIANLATWVASVDHYPALWAYSVIDEPVSRERTVLQQDEKIAEMRGLTRKTLFTVDWMNSPFEQKYSKNYDLVLINSYSMRYSQGDMQQRVKNDLSKFRLDYGTIKSQVGVKVIPCVSMFGFTDNANFFAADTDQIVAASKVFGKVAQGNYAAFVWDGEADIQITTAVRDNPKFQQLAIDLSKQAKLELKTETYKFGGISTAQSDWGIEEIINKIIKKDLDSNDSFIGSGAYPIVLKNGSIDTDRTSMLISTGNYVSGIGFKGGAGRLVTDIGFEKNLRVYIEVFSPTSIINGYLYIRSCSDGGYSSVIRYDTNINGNQVVNANINSEKSWGKVVFELINSNNWQHYRGFIRGVVINTDW